MQDDQKTWVKIEYYRIFRKFPVIPGRDSTPSNSREFLVALVTYSAFAFLKYRQKFDLYADSTGIFIFRDS